MLRKMLPDPTRETPLPEFAVKLLNRSTKRRRVNPSRKRPVQTLSRVEQFLVFSHRHKPGYSWQGVLPVGGLSRTVVRRTLHMDPESTPVLSTTSASSSL